MKRILKIIGVVALIAAITLTLTACNEAERVNWNLNHQADNFNITRRLTVWNARSDKVLLEIIGNMSLSNNASNELVVTVETEHGVYKKHYVRLNSWTLYVMEDVSGAYADPYHYEINFQPEAILPAFTNEY